MTAVVATRAGPRPTIWRRAPAKLNLTLHILGRRADGWHDLDSLVAFAGFGDWLAFEPGDRLALVVEGPQAVCVGAVDDNLVLRAARALAARVPGLTLGQFRLEKRLPVAAGLGGGSSDAAAALRALAEANGLSLDDERLWDAARAIGADVPVCLVPRARRMSGVGERLGPSVRLPLLFAVLVNPRVAVPTPRVFAELGLAPGQATGATPSPQLASGMQTHVALAVLAHGRNDLEASAKRCAPEIGMVLQTLAATPGVALARMSGSGATCFGLFSERRHAVRAASAIRASHPGWWVEAAVLR